MTAWAFFLSFIAATLVLTWVAVLYRLDPEGRGKKMSDRYGMLAAVAALCAVQAALAGFGISWLWTVVVALLMIAVWQFFAGLWELADRQYGSSKSGYLRLLAALIFLCVAIYMGYIA